VLVPFFGRPASTHRGPALFAIRLGAAVFSCIARRLPGDNPRYEVAGERVDVPQTGDVDADVLTLTSELALRLERQVRIEPEQYFWFHNRWKLPAPKKLVDDSSEED
jgi:KDO2-lipid IV(A) lauroyltransferase